MINDRLVRLLNAVEKAHRESLHWLDRARSSHSGTTADRFLTNYEKQCQKFDDAMSKIRQL